MVERMAVLHLLSNHRWTERAEPAANLALAERACGSAVYFACGTPRSPQLNYAASELEARGLAPTILDLPKHFSAAALQRDAPRVRALIEQHAIDVVHAHMLNAHMTAAWARRRARRRPVLVRTCYEPEGLPGGIREQWLARRAMDGVIVTTEEARHAAERRHARLRGRIALIEPGIDLDRFSPGRTIAPSASAPRVADDTFVVGIVSRLRKDRRIDIAIDALAALARDCPKLRLMIVGRGGSEEIKKAVTQPLARAGCGDRVSLAGYQPGDDLVAAYRGMRALLYPAPGTDKSCRTVREAMAAGVAVIGARVGYVPHLVEHEITGLLAAQDAPAFAAAIRRIYEDQTFLDRLRQNSLRRAQERFSLALQARRTLEFYRSLIFGV